MPEMTATIDGVTVKGTARGDVFKIQANGKELATFDRALATRAKELTGQSAFITYAEVQKGQYTNLYLDAIEPAGGTAGGFTREAPAAADPERELRIMRQTAVKAACTLAPSLDGPVGASDIFVMADRFVEYFQSGSVDLGAPGGADDIPF